jgi:hypothetical protein
MYVWPPRKQLDVNHANDSCHSIQERVPSRITKCVQDTVQLWAANNKVKFTEFFFECCKRSVACTNQCTAQLLCRFIAAAVVCITKQQQHTTISPNGTTRIVPPTNALAEVVIVKLLQWVDARNASVRQHCCDIIVLILTDLPPTDSILELEYVVLQPSSTSTTTTFSSSSSRLRLVLLLL